VGHRLGLMDTPGRLGVPTLCPCAMRPKACALWPAGAAGPCCCVVEHCCGPAFPSSPFLPVSPVRLATCPPPDTVYYNADGIPSHVPRFQMRPNNMQLDAAAAHTMPRVLGPAQHTSYEPSGG